MDHRLENSFYSRMQRTHAAHFLSEMSVINGELEQYINLFFKVHTEMGKKDRKAFRDWVYTLIRYKKGAESLLEQTLSWPLLSQLLTTCVFQWPGSMNHSTETPLHEADVQTFKNRYLLSLESDDPIEYALAYGLSSDWTLELKKTVPAQLLRQTFETILMEPTPTVMCNPRIYQQNISYLDPTLYSQLNYTIKDSKFFSEFSHKSHQDPWSMRFQDEGSTMISLFSISGLSDRPGPVKILDYCAGQGGKTQAMMQALDDKKQFLFYLWDKERYELIPQHSQCTILDKNPKWDDFKTFFDLVLCDVPCSQSGTVRRHPYLRLTSPKTHLLHGTTQQTILQQAASFVKPGGYLVYATCSLFDEENTLQVDRFLNEHPDFTEAPWTAAPNFINKENFLKKYHLPTHTLQIVPEPAGPDGFFIARMRKKV